MSTLITIGVRTLVDILAGRRKAGHVTGSVKLVCEDSITATSARVGYVDQIDILPASLSKLRMVVRKIQE